jgi:hypothetical protein
MIPVGKYPDDQYVYIIDKDMDGNVREKATLLVRYVPLTSVDEQLNN